MTAPSSEHLDPQVEPDPTLDDGYGPVVLPASRLRRARPSALRSVFEWLGVVAGSVLIALAVNAFLFQPFRIPSASMYPTLKVGDRVVVNKLSYDAHPVRRGDVVVFGQPACNAAGSNDTTHPMWATCGALEHVKDLVKRVVGLSGDTVSIHDDHVFINGRQLSEPYLPKGTAITAAVPGCSFPGSFRVPDGDVFVMGDNRAESFDSRCFGPIPKSLIIGRAFVRIWPFGRLATL